MKFSALALLIGKPGLWSLYILNVTSALMPCDQAANMKGKS